MEMIQEVLLDSLLDTVKLIPFLFLVYLFLEWLEHETTGKMEQFLQAHKPVAPIVGSFLGLLPECGVSTAASSLYTTGVISVGTLIAIFLSTSDEMLPIMISAQAPVSKFLPILLVKVIVSILAGLLVDHFMKPKKIDIDDFCEREHCDCEHENIFKAAFMHTLKITIWLFAITLLFNTIVELIGLETIASFIKSHKALSIVTCTLVGLIPSCASSILLSTLYLEGVIPFAAICAGLLVNAGVGQMVLFRVNPNHKENFMILGYTILVSLLTGTILSLFA